MQGRISKSSYTRKQRKDFLRTWTAIGRAHVSASHGPDLFQLLDIASSSLIAHDDDCDDCGLAHLSPVGFTLCTSNSTAVISALKPGATNNAKTKAGYSKIEYSRTQAAKEGLEHVWVDTCCIDKASSAELSEAINSMYQWYKAAKVCYAYLADVSIHDASIGAGFSSSNSAFATSKWFTRGWTLQELIAPPKLVFYDKDWNELGTKESLTSALAEVTGVDGEVLDGNLRPLDVSIARRMSWAAKRETTRLEDRGYSLMGIFDVNMPLLYGEGKKAFTRLLEEILKDSDDHSIFAWKAVIPPGDKDTTYRRGIFADSPAEFTDSRDIVPFRDWSESAPYSMTNKGLSIRLDMKNYVYEDSSDGHSLGGYSSHGHSSDGHSSDAHSLGGYSSHGHSSDGHSSDGHSSDGHSSDGHKTGDQYTAALNCRFGKAITQRVGIYLTCIHGDQFARIRPNEIATAKPDGYDSKTIFIRKELAAIHSDDDIRVFKMELPFTPRFILTSVYPTTLWNREEALFYASSTSGGPAGIFQFETESGTGFLAMIGLRSGGELFHFFNSQGWCSVMQLRDQNTLESLFHSGASLKGAGWSDCVSIDGFHVGPSVAERMVKGGTVYTVDFLCETGTIFPPICKRCSGKY